MKKVLFFAVMAFSVVLIGCKNDKTSDKIRVGVVMPLTGELAFLGQPFTNAILMNTDTSKVELFIQDTKGEPKIAINIVNQMIAANNIDVVISLKPAISETINPILEAKGITHFVFAYSPEITDAKNVVKLYPSSDDEDLSYLNYAKEKGFKSIVFLRHMFPDAELGYKTVVVPKSKEYGLTVYDEPFDEATKDFNNLTQKVKSHNSDLVVVQSLAYNFVNIVKSFQHAGIREKMLGDLNFNDLYTYDYEIVKEMENIPFLGLSYVLSDEYIKFDKEYMKKYGEKPTVSAAFPYDVMTVVNNMKESGIKKEDIIKYYNSHDVNGVTGKIVFNDKGKQEVKYDILKYLNGEFTK
jgi:branched-chain amino acid transport system substrate-binding protein